MCVIVAIGIAGYRGDAARVFKIRQFEARPWTHPVAAALPGETRLEVLQGGCSCSVYACEGGRSEFNAERERRRLKRKGWKPPRIEREIEARRAAHEKPRPLPAEETSFVAAVRALVADGARISLLAHIFSASFDDSFEIDGHTELPLAHFIATGGEFPENRIVRLVA